LKDNVLNLTGNVNGDLEDGGLYDPVQMTTTGKIMGTSDPNNFHEYCCTQAAGVFTSNFVAVHGMFHTKINKDLSNKAGFTNVCSTF
jgi:hypothetical protein